MDNSPVDVISASTETTADLLKNNIEIASNEIASTNLSANTVDVISESTETTSQSNSSTSKKVGYGILFAICLILFIGFIILGVLFFGTKTIHDGSIRGERLPSGKAGPLIKEPNGTYFNDSKLTDGIGLHLFLFISIPLAAIISGIGLLGSGLLLYSQFEKKKNE